MIPDLNSTDFEKLKSLLSVSRNIVITTHYKPDGDAMGSSLALYNFLDCTGHTVNVIVPSDYPDFLSWLKNNSEVCVYPKDKLNAERIIAEADIIFCLDFNHLSRTEKLAESLQKAKATKVLIDHHPEPDTICDLNFSFTDSCATSEILYHILKKLDEKIIDKAIAECLYIGIMTDTGSFRFRSTTADTHQVVAALLTKGAVNSKIHELVYDDFTEERTRFLGYCIQQKLVVIPEYRTAYIAITLDEQSEFHNKTGDTEGIVNYALSVKGVVMACLFIEHESLVKLSFRSKGVFSVREVASGFFNGGGHKNASGGKSTDSLDSTISKFIDLLPQFKDKLLKA